MGRRRTLTDEERVERRRAYYRANADRMRENAKRWRETNPERKKELTARWAQEHPERHREANRRYAENHRDEVNARRRARYAENGEVRKAQNEAWRRANPDKVLDKKRRRRARERQALGQFSSTEFRALCMESGYICVYCRRNGLRLVPDHDVPLSRGGSNDIANIVPACISCNAKKGAKTGDEFRALVL